MRLGKVVNGWRFKYSAHMMVAPASYYRGPLVEVRRKEGEPPVRVLLAPDMREPRPGMYVTPRGVGFAGKGVEIKDRTIGRER